MKKTYMNFLGAFVFVCACFTTNLNAQSVKISVANGDWFNPNTWNPPGVPNAFSPTDTLIVNTQVTFAQVLDARGVSNSAFIVNPGASLSGTVANDTLVLGVTDRLKNYGVISSNAAVVIGDIVIATDNYGQLSAGMIAQSDQFFNHGTITGGRLTQSDNFLNEPGAFINMQILVVSDSMVNKAGGVIVISDTLTNGATLVNNGDITMGNWINGQDAKGSGGRFCITNCFMNAGLITGTVDVCDATPLTFCDFNFGTISPSVTSCAAGQCVTTDISSYEANRVQVYPNPSTGIFMLGNNAIDVIVYNLAGETVLVQKQTTQINLIAQPKGVYFAQINSGGFIYRVKLVLN